MEKIIGKEYTILNPTPQMARIYTTPKAPAELSVKDNYYYILDFGKKSKGDLVEITLVYDSKDYKITSTASSCGCTDPTFVNTPDGKQTVNIKFDTNRVTQNVSKAFTLYMNGGTQDKIKFQLIINKT